MALTDWEAGQDFIAVSDYIAEKLEDIDKEKFKDVWKEMMRARAVLGDALDDLKSHDFGIFNSKDFKRWTGDN